MKAAASGARCSSTTWNTRSAPSNSLTLRALLDPSRGQAGVVFRFQVLKLAIAIQRFGAEQVRPEEACRAGPEEGQDQKQKRRRKEQADQHDGNRQDEARRGTSEEDRNRLRALFRRRAAIAVRVRFQ